MKVKKISNFFLMLLYLVLFFSKTCVSRAFSDSMSKIETRSKFIQKYSNLITKGKISYEYSEEKGYYCRANKDLYKSEIVMTVPKEFIICGCNNFYKL